MPRLPIPGQDAGAWGDILNEYLSQSLKSDGQLQDNAVTSSVLAPNSVTNSALASNAVNAAIIADGSITEVLLDTALQTKVNATAPVTSVASKTGAVTLVKGDVGLADVDNTSDATKNSATATLTNKTLSAPIMTGAAAVSQGGAFALYNTADQTTNYERARHYWSSSVYNIQTEQGGSGANRALQISAGSSNQTTSILLGSASGTTLRRNNTTVPYLLNVASTGLTATSGTQVPLLVDPVINQSGTAGYSILQINPTESTTGSGAKYLIDAQVGGVSRFSVDSTGLTTVATPTAAGHAATKGYVDTAASGKATVNADKFLMDSITNPDSRVANFTYNPNLYNDLFYNTYKGGSHTATKNGSPITLNESVFTPGVSLSTIDSSATPSDVYVITITPWKTFPASGLNRYGLFFQNANSAANVQVELFFNGSWNSDYNDTGQTPKQLHHFTAVHSYAIESIRITLTNAATSLVRIINIFGFAVNGGLLGEGYLERGGGNIYGTVYGQSLVPRTGATYGLGTSTSYYANTYSGRYYLNNTAYIDGGTAGEFTMVGNPVVTNGKEIQIFNTADRTTNYERARFFWTGDTFQVRSDAGGSGTVRSIALYASATWLKVNPASNVQVYRDNTTVTNLFEVTSVGLTSSNSEQVPVLIDPVMNQSGTAGYTMLKINPTETATGSGVKLLADFQVGGISKVSITNLGQLKLAASTTGAATMNIPTGVAPSSPVTGDIYSDGTHVYCYLASMWRQLD